MIKRSSKKIQNKQVDKQKFPKIQSRNNNRKNSMRFVLVSVFLLQIIRIITLNNLIDDPGFEIIGQNLPYFYNSSSLPYQPFYFCNLSNGDTKWYSLVSQQIIIRQKIDLNTVVMDTLSFDYYEKICQNFSFVGNQPYEFSFDYLIDNNIYSAFIIASFNDEPLFTRKVMQNYTQRLTFTVYLNQSINTLCFQGSNIESNPIGVLVDNITLAPYQIRYVKFIAVPVYGRTNQIELISNETVSNSSQLSLFIESLDINITGVQFTVLNVSVNQNNKLVYLIEIAQQYASSSATVSINLPIHRSEDGSLILYYINSENLPRYLYEDDNIRQITNESQYYLLLLVEIYNVCFRVIKIIGFCFIGIRFLNFFYLLLFLTFFNVQFILPSVRIVLGKIVALTINTQTFGFFMVISGKTPYQFGAQNIGLYEDMNNWNSAGLHYSNYNITPNLYSLIIDNLIMAVFNTLKVFLFIYIMFKGRQSIVKIFQQIKISKLFLQYITILAIVVLVSAACCSQTVGIVNYSGKFNRGFLFIGAFMVLFLCLVIFIRDKYNLRLNFMRHVKKYKGRSERRQKKKKYYENFIKLNLLENVMFFMVPGLVGIGNVYLGLIIFMMAIVGKFMYSLLAFRNKPNFLQFIWTITIFLQILLVFCYLIASIISSMPSMQANSQINSMNFLSYTSIALLYLYIVGGFLEIMACLYTFIRGFSVLSCIWKQISIKIANSIQKLNQIQVVANLEEQKCRNQGTSDGLKTVNQMKQKMDTDSNNSEQKIQNPFVTKSKKNIEKGIKVVELQSSSPKPNEDKSKSSKGRNRIINRMNIQPTEQGLKQKQLGNKFDIEEDMGNKRRAYSNKGEIKKMEYDHKNFKFTRNTEILPKIVEVSEGPQTFKEIGLGNFEKEENFT